MTATAMNPALVKVTDDGAIQRYYSVPQAARLSDLSESHVRRMIRGKKIPVHFERISDGRTAYFIEEDLVPIDSSELRATTPFKDEIAELIRYGKHLDPSVSDEDAWILEQYASGKTLVEIANAHVQEFGDPADTPKSRQRMHQIIKAAYVRVTDQ